MTLVIHSLNILDNYLQSFRKSKIKKPRLLKDGVSSAIKPDDDLLSHGNPHYHRRGVVSRSCSGWEGVVPTRYGHQAMTCCHVDGVNATNMGM